jgi:chorismate synthase
MPGNTFGYLFRLTSFGESHGPALGGIIDGCPAGLELDFDFIHSETARRWPDYPGASSRREPDRVEWLSGLKEEVTTGAPLAFLVRNQSANSSDYESFSDFFRPSHADFTTQQKYGVRDARGGGRSSGRETVCRVVAGAVAKMLLRKYCITIECVVTGIGPLQIARYPGEIEFGPREPLSLADPEMTDQVLELLAGTMAKGDTLGGTVACRIKGVPRGLGEPVFDKLHADLAKAMLSIGTARAFESGLGFQASRMAGSAYNDGMQSGDGGIGFLTNHDGGVQGGISNGEEIYFRVGFKPVPSIHLPQRMVNSSGESREITISGRHDACHVPRAVVVVEAMAALVVADHLLRNRTARI